MSELKYDPEYPYVVLFGDYVAARFPADIHGRVNAEDYAKQSVGRFVNTNPKTKIPEDAEFVAWSDEEGYIQVAAKTELDTWAFAGDFWSLPGLIDAVGNAEVTVLVRKEES